MYCVYCRVMWEITYRECQKHATKTATAPDYTDEEIAEGKRTKCPLCLTKRVIEALQEEVEAYLVNLLKDANLLAIHSQRVTFSPQISSWQGEYTGTRIGMSQTTQTKCETRMSQSYMLYFILY